MQKSLSRSQRHDSRRSARPRGDDALPDRELRERFERAPVWPASARGRGQSSRRQIAALIGARPNEIVFTSGGTEANNLAIRGVCEAAEPHGRHIITSAIEHPSARGPIDQLEKKGWEVTRLPVYDDGIVRVEDVRDAIRAGHNSD